MSNMDKKRTERVVIIGASGHARVIADIIRCSGDTVEGFVDDRDASEFPGLRVLGKVSDVLKLHREQEDLRFIIGIGKNSTRYIIAGQYGALPFYTAVHPSAVIAEDCVIGRGTVVMANAVINTGSRIGSHCILNTSATADHDSVIGDCAHISPGVHLGGTVCVGDRAWIGIGACVKNNTNICADTVVGAGAVVIRNIDTAGTYVGVPARKLKD